MRTPAEILDNAGFEELLTLAKGRDVLYVHPGGGQTVDAVATLATCVWTVGTPLDSQGPHDPTDAAELIHVLETGHAYQNTIALLGDPATLMRALVARRFDLVVIDWCPSQFFRFDLLLVAAALAPRVAVVGYGAPPRGTLVHQMFHGTGWLFYPAGTLAVLTDPTCPTLSEAEVY